LYHRAICESRIVLSVDCVEEFRPGPCACPMNRDFPDDTSQASKTVVDSRIDRKRGIHPGLAVWLGFFGFGQPNFKNGPVNPKRLKLRPK
jgi:hypothetical protein